LTLTTVADSAPVYSVVGAAAAAAVAASAAGAFAGVTFASAAATVAVFLSAAFTLAALGLAAVGSAAFFSAALARLAAIASFFFASALVAFAAAAASAAFAAFAALTSAGVPAVAGNPVGAIGFGAPLPYCCFVQVAVVVCSARSAKDGGDALRCMPRAWWKGSVLCPKPHVVGAAAAADTKLRSPASVAPATTVTHPVSSARFAVKAFHMPTTTAFGHGVHAHPPGAESGDTRLHELSQACGLSLSRRSATGLSAKPGRAGEPAPVCVAAAGLHVCWNERPSARRSVHVMVAES
jgi:hypothetical protein